MIISDESKNRRPSKIKEKICSMIYKTTKAVFISSLVFLITVSDIPDSFAVGGTNCTFSLCIHSFGRDERKCGRDAVKCKNGAVTRALALFAACETINPVIRLLRGTDCRRDSLSLERNLKARCDRNEVACIRKARARRGTCVTFCGTPR